MCKPTMGFIPSSAAHRMGKVWSLSPQIPTSPDTIKSQNKLVRLIHHNYHDHANDIEEPILATPTKNAKGSCFRDRAIGVSYHSVPRFPEKLHHILSYEIEKDGLAHIISWQPHGRCFVIHKPEEFKRQILPRYFDKCTKISSFQRQLSLYGFTRLTKGEDKGGYYHELFLRGKPFLVHQIARTTVKGTGVRARSNPEEEPNLWRMSWVGVPAENKVEVVGSSNTNMISSSSMVQQEQHLPAKIEQRMMNVPMMASSFDDNDIMTFGGKHFHYLDVNRKLNKPKEPCVIQAENDDLDNMLAQIEEDLAKYDAAVAEEDDKSEADFIRMIEEVLEQS